VFLTSSKTSAGVAKTLAILATSDVDCALTAFGTVGGDDSVIRALDLLRKTTSRRVSPKHRIPVEQFNDQSGRAWAGWIQER
jgi:hypothetical protein